MPRSGVEVYPDWKNGIYAKCSGPKRSGSPPEVFIPAATDKFRAPGSGLKEYKMQQSRSKCVPPNWAHIFQRIAKLFRKYVAICAFFAGE